MPMDVTLTIGGVNFRLAASNPSSSSAHSNSNSLSFASPIVSVKELGDTNSGGSILADLSNFSGTLKISLDNNNNNNNINNSTTIGGGGSGAAGATNIIPFSNSGMSLAEETTMTQHDDSAYEDDAVIIDESTPFLSSVPEVIASAPKTTTTRNIISSVQQQQQQQQNQPGSSSRLHHLLAGSQWSFKDVKKIVSSDPSLVSKDDESGDKPLHVLMRNEHLPMNLKEGEKIVKFLLSTCPDVVLLPDSRGNEPLLSTIHRWIDDVYTGPMMERSRQSMLLLSHDFDVDSVIDDGTNGDDGGGRHNGGADGSNNDCGGGGRQDRFSCDDGDDNFKRLFPSRVNVRPFLEWCLNMLSWFVNEKGGVVVAVGSEVESIPMAVVRRVAGIPAFVKTVLLITDEDLRYRVMESGIFRRVVLCKTTVGSWMVYMIKNKHLASRIVDYFELISKLTIRDIVGRTKKILPSDHHAFEKNRNEVFSKVEKYDIIIPSMVLLKPQDIERAATTKIIRQLLNKAISNPFVVSVVLIDLCLHIMYMIAFRAYAFNYAVFIRLGNEPGQEQKNWLHENPRCFEPSLTDYPACSAVEGSIVILLIFLITLHFLLRLANDWASMIRISRAVFLSSFFNVWNICQVTSIILASISALVGLGVIYPIPDGMAYIFSMTMGLLWLSLLGYLKSVNDKLSTYVLATLQVIKDIAWFLIILMAMVFMFADMVHIIETMDDDKSCLVLPKVDNTTSNFTDFSPDAPRFDISSYWKEDDPFCSNYLIKSYIYSINAVLLGNISLEDYPENTFITIIFLVCSVLLVVILLNILIALVCDSYEKTQVRADHIFGRARVEFATNNICLVRYLEPNPAPKTNDGRVIVSRLPSWFFGRLVRFLVLLSMILTSGVAILFIVILVYSSLGPTRQYKAYSNIEYLLPMIVGIAIFLMMSLTILFHFLFKAYLLPTHAYERILKNRWLYALGSKFYYVFRKVTNMIGVNPSTDENEDHNDENEEWLGQMAHLQKMTNQIVSESEVRIFSSLKRIEEKIVRDEAGIKSEIKADLRSMISVMLAQNAVNRGGGGRTSHDDRNLSPRSSRPLNFFDEEVEMSNRFF